MSNQETSSLLDKKNQCTIDTISILSDEPYINLEIALSEEQKRYRANSKSFKIRTFLNDKIDKHPLEQSFLKKLDFFLMSSAVLGYFIKTLNQTNISTAYINGMDEYYKMDRNQYNYLISFWTLGYVIGQVISNFILHRVNIRYYLGLLQVSWSIIAVLQFYADNLNTLYLLRFILALAEAPLFISLEYLLGSWYSSEELNKRSTFLAVSSSFASIISGPLQQSIIEKTKGSSLPPFKWMFLVDASITLPIGIFTMIANPNIPMTTNNWYWEETDKLVALERRRRIGAQLKKSENIDLAKVRQYIKSWHFIVFPLMFYAFNNSNHAISQPTFVSWMKIDLNLPSSYYNIIPSISHTLGIILAVSVGYVGDFLGGKVNHIFVIIYFVCMIIGTTLLSYWEIPSGLHWFCYFLIGVPSSWVQPQIFSWVNRTLIEDDSRRSFIVMATNTLAYLIGSWVPIFVWNTNDKPRYFIGFVYSAFLSGFGLIMTVIAYYFTKRDENLLKKTKVYSHNNDIASPFVMDEGDGRKRSRNSI